MSDRQRLCQLRRKKVTTRTLHWDAKTSFDLHTVAYDHARTDSVPSQGRRHLELCRSVDCALAPRFLAPVHVYPFSSLLSMLGSHRDQWEACVQRHDASYIAWRSSKEERQRTQEVLFLRRRGPQGPKVRTERVRSLCFLAFSWFLCLKKP